MRYLLIALALAACTSTEMPDYADCLADHDALYCNVRFYPDTPAPGEVAADYGTSRCMAPAEFAPLADFYAEDMARCREALAVRLGYDCGERALKRVAVDGDGLRSYYGRWGGVGQTVTRGDVESLAALQSRLPELRAALEADDCADWHENTHAAVGGLPLPAMLNEGLAVAMSPHSDIGCAFDFADLGAGEGAASWHESFTAMCLWDFLASEGMETGDVLRAIAAMDGDFYLIADALGRPDLRDEMRERFGVYDWLISRNSEGWNEAIIRGSTCVSHP